ncbi:MAG TPA: NAD-dependent epimerase/dehydratase family protein [Elusimicrobiales bacterium]|nr:NAD-dependent epimerase/dehydratase family protein [Elusimicrobiales bacterium]
MKTIAVTGGTGFVGSALSKALLAKGYAVRIITRSKPARPLPGAAYAEADFSDVESLTAALAGAYAVVHLAAALFCRSKESFITANATGTKNVAAAAAAGSVEKLVYLSSLAAGGPSGPGADKAESQPDAPTSYYGMGKLEGEKHVKDFKGGKFVILRPPIIYGRKDSGFSKIAEWVRRGVMVNAGSADGRFSFLFLDDLVRALLETLETDKFNGGTFYVCERRSYAWREFITLLAAGMGVKMPLLLSMPPWAIYAVGGVYEAVSALAGAVPVMNRDKAREAAGPNWTASPALWEKTAGWNNWTPLQEGISKTFK